MSENGRDCLWGKSELSLPIKVVPANCGDNTSGWCNPDTYNNSLTVPEKMDNVVMEKFKNIIDSGADPTGAKDSTDSIQKAINDAGIGGGVYFPKGTYVVSKTLLGLTNQTFIGESPNTTMIYRIGNYGDTLRFNNAGAVNLSGIWFKLSEGYDGKGNLKNVATSGSHLYLNNCQFSNVENCWFWRMPFNIRINGTITTIRKCWLSGTWDPKYTSTQEGIANIFIEKGTIITVENCYITGDKSALRDVTYTATDGTLTVKKTENVASKYGIYITNCEDFICSNNFIGVNSIAGIYSDFKEGSINLEWRIIGNFFDDGPTIDGGANIYLNTASNATLNGLTITGNVFNGEQVCMHAIVFYNAFNKDIPLVSNFVMSSNTFQAYVGTEVNIYSGINGIIHANTFTGYNELGVSKGADVTFCAGLLLFGNTSYLHVYGNNFGGSTNTGAPVKSTYMSVENRVNNPSKNSIHDNLVVV
jgi:hypothetical protein